MRIGKIATWDFRDMSAQKMVELFTYLDFSATIGIDG